jgi:hypothetical protein
MLTVDSSSWFNSGAIGSAANAGDAGGAGLEALAAQAASAAAAARQVEAAFSHRQSYIRHHVDAALIQGHAPGLSHAGQSMEWREIYVAFRLQQKTESLNASRAAAEWNRLAATHVATLAGAGLDAHRERFIQAHVDCVLLCGRAPGLMFAGRNIEDRQTWVSAAGRDGSLQGSALPAQQRWNWLASEHARKVACAIYIRQHPLPPAGLAAPGKTGELTAQPGGSNASMQFQMAQSAQILMQISQASGPVRTMPEPIALQDMARSGDAMPEAPELEMPDPAMAYSEENYGKLQGMHKRLSQAWLEEFMRRAPNALLFKIYIDPAMQDNQFDLQDMASKVLYERRH